MLSLVFPVACLLVPGMAILVTYIAYRDDKLAADLEKLESERDARRDAKIRVSEVPGDTVTMYVELEVDEEADRRRRERAIELDGRSLRAGEGRRMSV